MSETPEIIDVTRCSRAYGEIRSGWRFAALLAIVLAPFWFDSGTRLAILASCVLTGLSWSLYRLKPIATVAFSIALGFLTIFFLLATGLWRDAVVAATLVAVGGAAYLGHTAHAVFTYKQCRAQRSLSGPLQCTLRSARMVPWRVLSAGRMARRILSAILGAAASGLLTCGFGVLVGLWQSQQALFLGVALSFQGIVQFVLNDPHFVDLTLGLLIGAGLVWLGFWLLRYARRSWMLRAEEVTRRDLRRPILILRSFKDDMLAVERDSEGIIERIRRITLSRGPVFEETVTRALAMFGPVIAIGRPGEMLPALGAAREYVSDSVWKERAVEWVAQSSIVTVILGRGDSLQWEMERLVQMEALHKVIAVFPPLKRDELVARWKILETLFNIKDCSIASFLRGSNHLAMAATFDEMKKPFLIVGDSRKDSFYREAVLEGACQIFKTMRSASSLHD